MSPQPMERKATGGRERPLELPERWSVGQKAEVVLRLLRGDDLGELSREVQVTPPELEEWRRVFLEGGRQGLKSRSRSPAWRPD
ncbi:MAG: helix-turn-helix domain-containing protein [Gemmatimonadetes bacterium]|nr:helix-turn-helix domain-containing protein [Gemmatimonadota bacterium]